jgi:hypothetical protein
MNIERFCRNALARHSSVKSCLPAVALLFWQKCPKPCAPNARPSQTSCLLGYSSTCVLASAGRELAHEQHGCCECQKCRSIFWPSAQTPRPIPSARCYTSRLAHGALCMNTRSCAELSLAGKSCMLGNQNETQITINQYNPWDHKNLIMHSTN